MEILINGKQAVLKSGTSFEYIAENRAFSGSDGYTLSITFPLRGCDDNLAIFGDIHRADVLASHVVFDCTIRHGSFVKSGTVTVVGISEKEVKTQFLEGRSEQNFDFSLDEVFVNELPLGEPPALGTDQITPARAWDAHRDEVALPWVNDSSGTMLNKAVYGSDGEYSWDDAEYRGLSWQPYLIVIARRICEAIGYACDFDAWEASPWRWLLMCNTLPAAWESRNFGEALPHWSVPEFFEKLELLMACEFDFDHRSRSVRCAFSHDVVAAIPEVCLEDVVDERSVDIAVEDVSCDYSEACNLVYKECDNDMWQFWSCDWFVCQQRNVERYATFNELLTELQRSAVVSTDRWGFAPFPNLLYYAEDVETYFLVRALRRVQSNPGAQARPMYDYYCALQPVNIFGGRIASLDEDAEEREIEFVPVRVDYTEPALGQCMFLPLGTKDDDTSSPVASEISGADENDTAKYIPQPYATKKLLAGNRDNRGSEFYDRVYVGFWDGTHPAQRYEPFPVVDSLLISENWTVVRPRFSLRINDRAAREARGLPQIDVTTKVTFKFLSDVIPDPRAVFVIRGKRYVCEKLTATFSERGMSSLLKGIFYPVKEG